MLEKISSARAPACVRTFRIPSSFCASIATPMAVDIRIAGMMLAVINVSFHWMVKATIDAEKNVDMP